MGVGLKAGMWMTHRQHAEEERIRAKEMALKTATFSELGKVSIKGTCGYPMLQDSSWRSTALSIIKYQGLDLFHTD